MKKLLCFLLTMSIIETIAFANEGQVTFNNNATQDGKINAKIYFKGGTVCRIGTAVTHPAGTDKSVKAAQLVADINRLCPEGAARATHVAGTGTLKITSGTNMIDISEIDIEDGTNQSETITPRELDDNITAKIQINGIGTNGLASLSMDDCGSFTSTPVIGKTGYQIAIDLVSQLINCNSMYGTVVQAIKFGGGVGEIRFTKLPSAFSTITFDVGGNNGLGDVVIMQVSFPTLVLFPRDSINQTNTQHCVSAVVLDTTGPIFGTRVDFQTKGANPGIGFAFTDTSGSARYCYVGTNPGRDTIIGSSLNLKDTVFKLWQTVSPVELISFSSTVNKNDVTLNWITSVEENNSGFEIERSNVKDQMSNDWTQIGFVNGQGNSNVASSYSFEDRNLSSGKYNYRLKQIDFNGNFQYFDLQNEVVIGVPDKFSLAQNYPNPFNPTTKIDYDLPFDSKVRIVLFDILGREVARLANEVKKAGYYTLDFDASNLSSGAYFYRISAERNGKSAFEVTKRMMLVK